MKLKQYKRSIFIEKTFDEKCNGHVKKIMNSLKSVFLNSERYAFMNFLFEQEYDRLMDNLSSISVYEALKDYFMRMINRVMLQLVKEKLVNITCNPSLFEVSYCEYKILSIQCNIDTIFPSLKVKINVTPDSHLESLVKMSGFYSAKELAEDAKIFEFGDVIYKEYDSNNPVGSYSLNINTSMEAYGNKSYLTSNVFRFYTLKAAIMASSMLNIYRKLGSILDNDKYAPNIFDDEYDITRDRCVNVGIDTIVKLEEEIDRIVNCYDIGDRYQPYYIRKTNHGCIYFVILYPIDNKIILFTRDLEILLPDLFLRIYNNEFTMDLLRDEIKSIFPEYLHPTIDLMLDHYDTIIKDFSIDDAHHMSNNMEDVEEE